MDNTNSHNLTGRERIELQSRIQKLEWLLKECIGLEEYELCSQIRNIIHNSYQKIDESQR
jgi:hypothetical protein